MSACTWIIGPPSASRSLLETLRISAELPNTAAPPIWMIGLSPRAGVAAHCGMAAWFCTWRDREPIRLLDPSPFSPRGGGGNTARTRHAVRWYGSTVAAGTDLVGNRLQAHVPSFPHP